MPKTKTSASLTVNISEPISRSSPYGMQFLRFQQAGQDQKMPALFQTPSNWPAKPLPHQACSTLLAKDNMTPKYDRLVTANAMYDSFQEVQEDQHVKSQ